MRDDDRTALVTGGARGIGLEIGRQLADRGLRVLVGARKREAAEEACRTIGPAALPLALDVTSATSVGEAVREARELTGGIDVLVEQRGSVPGRGTAAGAWRVVEAVVPGMSKPATAGS
jgi:NAD(P)-dependent dehydrogenase (short-subunit alcohol dehydrogenase family)